MFSCNNIQRKYIYEWMSQNQSLYPSYLDILVFKVFIYFVYIRKKVLEFVL